MRRRSSSAAAGGLFGGDLTDFACGFFFKPVIHRATTGDRPYKTSILTQTRSVRENDGSDGR